MYDASGLPGWDRVTGGRRARGTARGGWASALPKKESFAKSAGPRPRVSSARWRGGALAASIRKRSVHMLALALPVAWRGTAFHGADLAAFSLALPSPRAATAAAPDPCTQGERACLGCRASREGTEAHEIANSHFLSQFLCAFLSSAVGGCLRGFWARKDVCPWRLSGTKKAKRLTRRK